MSRFEAAVDDPNSEVQRDIKTNSDYKTIAKLDEEEEVGSLFFCAPGSD